uniref:(northern house mosquito) hypothetical protein n=1 Tax=Culex pipiens TaxID=7175 RepID=A0A8D8BH95_CULPI
MTRSGPAWPALRRDHRPLRCTCKRPNSSNNFSNSSSSSRWKRPKGSRPMRATPRRNHRQSSSKASSRFAPTVASPGTTTPSASAVKRCSRGRRAVFRSRTNRWFRPIRHRSYRRRPQRPCTRSRRRLAPPVVAWIRPRSVASRCRRNCPNRRWAACCRCGDRAGAVPQGEVAADGVGVRRPSTRSWNRSCLR